MITLTPRLEFGIKIFCVLILLFLNFSIWYNGKELTCDNCKLYFEANKREENSASNKLYQNFSIRIVNLYEGLLENYCLVEFDRMQGYYVKNVTWIK